MREREIGGEGLVAGRRLDLGEFSDQAFCQAEEDGGGSWKRRFREGLLILYG
jgi:hypothetical protein